MQADMHQSKSCMHIPICTCQSPANAEMHQSKSCMHMPICTCQSPACIYRYADAEVLHADADMQMPKSCMHMPICSCQSPAYADMPKSCICRLWHTLPMHMPICQSPAYADMPKSCICRYAARMQCSGQGLIQQPAVVIALPQLMCDID